jgi:CBS domain-containing protein
MKRLFHQRPRGRRHTRLCNDCCDIVAESPTARATGAATGIFGASGRRGPRSHRPLGEQSKMVSEAMSAVVLSIGPSHTLREAAQRMVERGVGSAVINDPDAMGPGLIAERDIVRAVAAGLDIDTERVVDHMATDTIIAVPSWPLEQAAQVMLKGRARHLVVVDGYEVVGVVSIRDIIAAWEPLAQRAHGITPTAA